MTEVSISDQAAAAIAKAAAAGDVVLVCGSAQFTENAYDAVLQRLAPERFIRASRVRGSQTLDLADGGRVMFRNSSYGVRGLTADLVYVWPGWPGTPEQPIGLSAVLAAGARLLPAPTDPTTEQPTTEGTRA